MDDIVAKSKEYEYLAISRDPLFESQIKATEIVKKYIRDNGLIVYGGTAIDYALRLHGDKIYSDDMQAVPDLDFFSSNHVEDSYKLADLLFAAGFSQARAIYALHIETQKVDLKDNHWMADITYRPAEVLRNLPTIDYDGMKIIHPDYQRLDIHSSLSFPYDDPPKEVIFARWSKDIKRFNMLDKYYPIEPKVSKTFKSESVSIPKMVFDKCMPVDFMAYAAICRTLLDAGESLPKEALKLNFKAVSNAIVYDEPKTTSFVSQRPESACKYLELTNIKHYHPYVNIIPEHFEGKFSSPAATPVNIYSSEHRLLSHVTTTIDSVRIRLPCVQYILMQFLSKWFKYRDELYRDAYASLLLMVKNSTHPVLCLSVKVFGSDNISLSKTIAMNMLRVELDGAEPIYKPMNYRAEKQNHPEFDITKMLYAHESGELVA